MDTAISDGVGSSRTEERGESDLSIAEMISQYQNKRKVLECLEEEIKSLKVGIVKTLVEMDSQSFRVKDGPLAYLKADMRARINQEDQATAYAWLRDNGHGGLIRQKEEIHHGTLTAWAKERMEAGEEVPPCIRVSMFDTLCVEKEKTNE